MLTPEIKRKIDAVIVAEGGDKYTNNPNDKGGPTKYGVTQVTYRAFGFTGDVKDCTYEQAVQIYAERFFYAPKLDQVAVFSQDLANLMFSWGVNSGPSAPATALQRALNVLNRQAKDYPDIAADGSLGRMSFDALSQFNMKRGVEGMKNLEFMVRSQWSVFYMNLAERNPSQEEFESGWQNRARGA